MSMKRIAQKFEKMKLDRKYKKAELSYLKSYVRLEQIHQLAGEFIHTNSAHFTHDQLLELFEVKSFFGKLLSDFSRTLKVPQSQFVLRERSESLEQIYKMFATSLELPPEDGYNWITSAVLSTIDPGHKKSITRQ